MSAKREKDEELLRNLTAEYTLLRSFIESAQRQIELLSNALAEISLTKATLEELKKCEGEKDILLHIGSGTYVNATVKDVSRVIFGIGAGYSVDKSLDDALKKLEERGNALQQQLSQSQAQLSQALARLETIQGQISSLYAKLGGQK